MVDHDNNNLFGKIVLSLARKTGGNEEPPHLEDIPNNRDGRTASLDSIDADHNDIQFLENQKSKKSIEEPPTILQPVPIPPNNDPAMAALLASLNQTNALILQQRNRIGAWENKR